MSLETLWKRDKKKYLAGNWMNHLSIKLLQKPVTEDVSVKVLSHPGHGVQVQVESKATGLSVGS